MSQSTLVCDTKPIINQMFSDPPQIHTILQSNILFFAIITLIRAFGVGNAWVPSWTFAGQRTIWRSQFLPSIMWVPRTEFRFDGKRLYLLSYLSRPCQKYFHVSHRLRQEYLGFEVSLSYRVRSHLKRKQMCYANIEYQVLLLQQIFCYKEEASMSDRPYTNSHDALP